jgi:hypothetical protein
MRYHKAIKVGRPEADFIIQKGISPSLNNHVVIKHLDSWYDVRTLTDKEVNEFAMDLLRAEMADVTAGRVAPH